MTWDNPPNCGNKDCGTMFLYDLSDGDPYEILGHVRQGMCPGCTSAPSWPHHYHVDVQSRVGFAFPGRLGFCKACHEFLTHRSAIIEEEPTLEESLGPGNPD